MLALVAVLEINRALLHHGDLSVEELPVVPSMFNSLVLGGERPDHDGAAVLYYDDPLHDLVLQRSRGRTPASNRKTAGTAARLWAVVGSLDYL